MNLRIELDVKFMEKPAIEGGQPVAADYIPFCPPKIGEEELEAVGEVLKSGWLSTGKKAQQFEADLKAYLRAKNVLALNSCTAGLHLAVLGMGVGPGDEVLVPAMTFAATANVVEICGAKAVFVDSEEGGFNIDAGKLEEKITPKTKAVIPVHFAGCPAEMDEIRKIAKAHGLAVIEDAAHAVGAEYRGKKIGSWDNLAAFSFYPTKNMTAIEGGALSGGDEQMFARLRMMSLHGMSKDAHQRFSKEGAAHYDIEVPGYKYNMPDVSAAIGVCQLKKLDGFNKTREKYAAYLYDRLASAKAIMLPKRPAAHVKNTWHMFPLLIDPARTRLTRDRMLEAMKKENVGVGVHYRLLPGMSYYREKYGLGAQDFPRAAFIGDNTFSIPFSHSMSEKQLEAVADALLRIDAYYAK